MVQQHEGADSAGWFSFWWDRQPEVTLFVRAPDGEVLGLVTTLRLEEIAEADRRRDPAVMLAMDQLDRLAPLQPGERVAFFRFWLTADGYQDQGPVQLFITLQFVRFYLSTARLAVSFVSYADLLRHQQRHDQHQRHRHPAQRQRGLNTAPANGPRPPGRGPIHVSANLKGLGGSWVGSQIERSWGPPPRRAVTSAGEAVTSQGEVVNRLASRAGASNVANASRHPDTPTLAKGLRKSTETEHEAAGVPRRWSRCRSASRTSTT